MSKLEQARKEYKQGIITFKELESIFDKEATDSEKNLLWCTPTFDRPGVIIGRTQQELDNEFNSLIE